MATTDVLAFYRSVRGGRDLTPWERELYAFAKSWSQRFAGASAIEYDEQARRFRVTLPRAEWDRLRRASPAEPAPGTWTAADGERYGIDVRLEKKRRDG